MPLTKDQAVSPAGGLTYDRTVSRSWVNRRSVSEVFLTDFRPVDDTTFVCAPQLPLQHAYFSDHLTRPETYDLLLLLECSRQAPTYGGDPPYKKPGNTRNLLVRVHPQVS